MNFFIGLKNSILISLVLWTMIFFTVKAFGEEIVTKVDDYTARVVVSTVNEKEGTKTTVSQERTFTLEELTQAKTASEGALKSWQDEKVKCEENITLQTNQIALWQRLIDETIKQGVVEKPIEKSVEEIKP